MGFFLIVWIYFFFFPGFSFLSSGSLLLVWKSLVVEICFVSRIRRLCFWMSPWCQHFYVFVSLPEVILPLCWFLPAHAAFPRMLKVFSGLTSPPSSMPFCPPQLFVFPIWWVPLLPPPCYPFANNPVGTHRCLLVLTSFVKISRPFSLFFMVFVDFCLPGEGSWTFCPFFWISSGRVLFPSLPYFLLRGLLTIWSPVIGTLCSPGTGICLSYYPRLFGPRSLYPVSFHLFCVR